MRSFLNKSFKVFRLLFNFRKPALIHFDYIDILFENKLLLLFSWQASNALKICARPGKITDYRNTGAGVYKLPSNTTTVFVIVRNIWRSKKIALRLKYIKPNALILQYINEQFLTAPSLKISVNTIVQNIPAAIIKERKPVIAINPTLKPIKIYIQPFQPTNDVE